jgi:hypothetical protein
MPEDLNTLLLIQLNHLKTKIGNFEWQVITGRLESSGYLPANSDFQYAGTNIYVPKINQKEKQMIGDISRIHITYSPKWVSGLSLGFIRWVQMYSALVEGKYGG